MSSSWVGPAIQAGGAVAGGALGSKGSKGASAPRWLKRGAKELGQFGQQLGQTPYTPYEGNRVAGFSPDTMAAFDMIRNNVGAATPAYQQAMNTMTENTGYQAPTVGNVSASQWAGQSLDPYMNPYIKNVIDASAADQREAYGQSYNSLASQAQAAGAFGGSRFGVAQGQLEADSVRDQALLSAQLRSQGFDTAAGLLSQDVDRQNWATGLNQETGFRNQAANLAAANLRGASANSLGALGGAYQASLAQDANALGGIGSAQQALEQKGLDVGYEDYWDQTRNYPSQQMAWWSGGYAPAISAAGLAAPTVGGGALGALGGAYMGSQVGDSIYNWWQNRQQPTSPSGSGYYSRGQGML